MSFDSWVNHGAPLSAKSFRGVNNNDVVTAVPPEFSDYQHVGTKIYINSRWVGALVRGRLEQGTTTRQDEEENRPRTSLSKKKNLSLKNRIFACAPGAGPPKQPRGNAIATGGRRGGRALEK